MARAGLRVEPAQERTGGRGRAVELGELVERGEFLAADADYAVRLLGPATDAPSP